MNQKIAQMLYAIPMTFFFSWIMLSAILAVGSDVLLAALYPNQMLANTLDILSWMVVVVVLLALIPAIGWATTHGLMESVVKKDLSMEEREKKLAAYDFPINLGSSLGVALGFTLFMALQLSLPATLTVPLALACVPCVTVCLYSFVVNDIRRRFGR